MRTLAQGVEKYFAQCNGCRGQETFARDRPFDFLSGRYLNLIPAQHVDFVERLQWAYQVRGSEQNKWSDY